MHLVFSSKLLTAPFASDYLEQILNQLSKAVLLAVNGDRAIRGLVPHALHDLAKLEARPLRLTEIAYEWCSAIYANRENLGDWEGLLFVCLELGFRHLDPRESYLSVTLTHTEHHRGLVDVVFKCQKIEVIADLLRAWTTGLDLPKLADEMVGSCTGHIIALHNLVPFSPRLRQSVIRFIERAGYKGFNGAGMEKLTELLDHLHVTAEEMGGTCERWPSLLLGIVKSPGGTQHLSNWYWGLLVELAVSEPWRLEFWDTDALKIANSLIDAEEWGKLECWMGIVWTVSESEGITGEDLEHPTLLLLRHRPGAAQRLEQWMERWNQRLSWIRVPESFHRILTRTHEAVHQQNAP